MTCKLKSLNPATGEVVGEVPITPVDDIPRIVNLSREASQTWRATTLEERGVIFKKVRQHLLENAEDLGTLLSQEMGKPLKRGIGEVTYCGNRIPVKVDEIIEALRPRQLEDEHTRSTSYYDPFGICAAITPWNFPISMPQSLVLPALMAGNSVILKPSEETPLIAQKYVDILNEFLPEDVLQVVHGEDIQGKALVQADIDMIAFTGSRATGKNILSSAAEGLKRVIFELGGKDPLIVLVDAEIDKTAEFAVSNSFDNSGQVCVSTERIYVAEEIAEEFENKVAELASKVRIGIWQDEEADIGPMINERQRDHVLRQIDDAVRKGALILYGGKNHPDRFILPTVLAGVTEEMDIMQEETFGPVACICRFKDVDEAIQLVNNSPYGLGAAVFGRDEKNAFAVARRLESGMIGVNKACFAAAGAPWVGAKQSGYGYHGSAEGHRQFTQVRVISRAK